MKRFVAFLLLWIVSSIFFHSALAENESTSNSDPAVKDGNLAVFEDVIVKEKKDLEHFSAELGDYGHPVEIITGEQIRASGFVDLSKIVESVVPGIFSSSRQGRGGWTFTYLQGSDDILWLLDGVRINNPLYGTDWSTTISVHLIERIEVLKGGEGIFYGTGARAGVINIITKKTTSKTSGEVGAAYGQQQYQEVYGHISDSLKGHGFMVFGSHEGSDGYQVCDNTAYGDAQYTDKKHEVGFDRTTVGLKYSKTLNLPGDAIVKAQLQKQQGYFDYPYPMYRYAYNDWEEEIGTLRLDHDVNKSFSYYLKAYYHLWWGEVTFVDPDGSYSWGTDRSNETPWGYQDYGASITTSTRWGGGHEILAGLDYQNYWGKEQVVNIPRTDRVHSGALIASYRPYLPFSPKTNISIGGRHTITSEDVSSTIWDMSIKTPVVGATYFRAMTGTSFSLPTLLQLYGDNPASNKYGNPDLDPEQSLNIEAGFGGNWSRFRFDAGYFYQDVQDMITSVTLDNGNSTYANAEGTTEIQGAEAQAGFGPFNGLTLTLSCTWVSAKDKETDEQQEQIPEFYATANMGYRSSTGRIGVDLRTRYIGDIYERGLDPFDDVNYGHYFLADLSAFLRFGQDKRHRLTLRYENIFDETYATRYNRATDPDGKYFLYHQNGLPRNIILGYSYTF